MSYPAVIDRVAQGDAESGADRRYGHDVDVPVCLAGSRLQVLASAPVDIQDIALRVDQCGGRGIVLQHQLVGQLLQIRSSGRQIRHSPILEVSARCGAGWSSKCDHRHAASGFGAAIQAHLRRERSKKYRRTPDGFGLPEQQHAARSHRVMEQTQQALLELRVEIDHHVAARQQVQPGKRWVQNHIVLGEEHHVPYFLGHHESRARRLEKARHALLPDGIGNASRVVATARRRDGIGTQIRREDLDPAGPGIGCVGERLGKQHGERVRLFASGAADDPRSHRQQCLSARQQGRDHHTGQFLPDLWITKVLGYSDQDLLEQQVDLGRVFPQKSLVIGIGTLAVHAHASFDAAAQCVGLVQGQIVFAPAIQERENAAEIVRVGKSGVQGMARAILQQHASLWRPHDAHDVRGQLRRVVDDIDGTGIHRAPGH